MGRTKGRGARQYGKTTTLTALRKVLSPEYSVLSLDFQGLGMHLFRQRRSSAEGLPV